tara:strand:- start:16435 stop:16602 length:168 start_codon:yes stop_codon:yes gene_type:complete
MKIKLKSKTKLIPPWNSYGGLTTEDWEALNNGKTIEIKKVPDEIKELTTQIKEAK